MHYYTWLATKEPITEENYWNYMEKYYYDNNKTEFVDETEDVIKSYNSEEKRKVRKTNSLYDKCGFEFIYDSPWRKDITEWGIKDYKKYSDHVIYDLYNYVRKLPISLFDLDSSTKPIWEALSNKYQFNDELSITFNIKQSEKDLEVDFYLIKKLVKSLNRLCPIEEKTIKKLYPNIEDYVNDYHGYTIEIINNEPRYGYWVNPDSLFDWCVIGGRWKDNLISKFLNKGVDCCIKSDLDLDRMTNQWIDYLREEFNKDKDLQACYKDVEEYLTIHNNFYPYTFIIDTGEYHNKWKHLHSPSYHKRSKDHTRVDLLKDDKQDQIKHNQIIQTMFNKLPDNYYITIIDMHN